MPKISKHGGPSYAGQVREVLTAELPPFDGDVEREAEGIGEPGHGVEVPADGVEREFVAEPEPEVVAPPVTMYESWSLTSLRDECFRRALSKTGNKDELIVRLVEYDSAADGGAD